MVIQTTAATELKAALDSVKKNGEYAKMMARRGSVLAKYQPIFSLKNIQTLTEEEFRSFLNFENNGHWNGLHRQGSKICADMGKLKAALHLLIDEDKPLASRFDEAVKQVPGMGKAIATAILLVSNPQKYGVWNSTSEFALEKLGLFPTRQRAESLGNFYERVNAVLLEASHLLEIDLWALDGLWWFFIQEPEQSPSGNPNENISSSHPTDLPAVQRFELERHLHHFLEDNWDSLALAKEWEIYSKPGEPDLGIEFKVAVGKIDILAKHKTEKRWLVIELKRNKTNDEAVGQVLRYMGFLRSDFAAGELVEGLIITHSVNSAIKYALSAVSGVKVCTYEINFALKDFEG